MSTQAGKQVFSLPVNKLWKRYFAQLVRTKSNVSFTEAKQPAVLPCSAAVLGRSISPCHGGSNTPSALRFSRTYAVGGNVFSGKPLTLTLCATSNQTQFLSTTSQHDGAPTDQKPDSGNQETPVLAPHFRTQLKKTERVHPKTHGPAGVLDENEEDENGQYLLPHPIWSDNELNQVEVTHQKPNGFVDWFAYGCVQTMRFGFDLLSGYKRGTRTEGKWLIRIIFLETVAGVPGMVAAMSRHLRSLRRLQRDHGWIHTLLEEAENERMHLMTALELRKPGRLFTMAVLLSQGICVNLFFLAYMCSPRFCHRFVGYLEEEAVITYTKLIKDLDDGKLPKWGNMAAPDLAVRYWKLKPDAMIRDMVLAIRADEAHHREVNHSLSDLKPDDSNPYPPGK